jgi:hypothetical protein
VSHTVVGTVRQGAVAPARMMRVPKTTNLGSTMQLRALLLYCLCWTAVFLYAG